MGYTTDFYGKFELNKKLDDKLHQFLTKFSASRRVMRTLPTEYGIDGEFFVDGYRGFGTIDANKDSIVDYNTPPYTQPGLWCQWTPSDDGMSIEWDGGEKFYNYREWLLYIIQNFLHPNGYILNGVIAYKGESSGDYGDLVVQDNILYDARDSGPLTLYTAKKPQLSQINFITEIKLLS